MKTKSLIYVLATFLSLVFSSINSNAQCVDEMEIDIFGPKGTIMTSVTVPSGQTLSGDVFFRRALPGVGAVAIEINISPQLHDGFPGETLKVNGEVSPYNTWVNGDNDSGTFTFTNNTSFSVFVLEINYTATRTADQEDGLSGGLKNIRVNGASTCAEAHVAPERPTWSFSCATLPSVNVGGPTVYTEPFSELEQGETFWLRMADELPLRFDQYGNVVPYGRWFEDQFGTRVTLQGRVNGGAWDDIRSRARLSRSRSWGRETYLRGSTGLNNISSILFDEYRLKLESTSSEPVDGSSRIHSMWIWDGQRSRRICLESTQTTVFWDAQSSCASDRTNQLRAYVTNKSDDLKNYRIRVFDPISGDEIHSSSAQLLLPGETGKIALSGIPSGRWKLRMYEDGVQVGSTITQEFDNEDCDYRVEWSEKVSCADDATLELIAEVTNHGRRLADFRMRLFDPETGAPVHASLGTTIAQGETKQIKLGGVPEGTWVAKIYRDVFFQVGDPYTVTFDRDETAANGICDVPPTAKTCTADEQLTPLANLIAQNVTQPSIMEHSSVSSSLMVTGCNTVPSNGISIGGPEIFAAAKNLIATADHEVIIQTFSWDSDSEAVSELGRGLRIAQDNLDFDEKLTVRLLMPDQDIPQGQLPVGLTQNPHWQTLDPDKFDIYFGVGGLWPGDVHHDKAVIVDGISMLITGANPQNRNNTGVSWYDIGVRIDGPASIAAVENFDHYWRNTEYFRAYHCTSFSNPFCEEIGRDTISRPWRQKEIDTTGAIQSVSLSRVNSGISIAGNDINNPQDEAWSTVFDATPAGSNISIITPNINDDQFRAGVIAASQRGVNVRILTGMGFNDQPQVADGGTNCQVVDELLQKGNDHLFIRWHVSGGVIVQDKDPGQTHAKFMAVTNESGQGILSIVGSGNHDTQSWDRSHEYNVLLDGQEITDRLVLESFAPVWNIAVPATIGLCDEVRDTTKDLKSKSEFQSLIENSKRE